jgi:replicative DNA helicase
MVLYISLEMSENQIIERLISMKALRSFKFNDYNNKRYSQSDMELFNYAIAEIEKYPCMINANFVASINDVRNQIAQLSNSYSVQFLVIDHLHIMSYDQNHENQEIANITKNLKAIAKQYNLSVLLLSQVNKNASTFGFNSKESIKKTDVEKDENEHQIHMNDIRGSGAPVQDAAIVMLM